ncbi:hypothetical protein BD780_000110 [Clostridium tetanomorphum]|uniref:Uncharacterized protein n=1 Tax=Clostridium tetanomorphum TaxID=1553 RepID=A0A923IZX9_CLOTT|nr:DUF6762 family protein [Clostridium tetanomorphum]KAJ50882.1 hypothetical protein CTM_15603 [Clostridium tetanomorphum DSM 665]KAJ52132.1 hypothetical protein CTM_10186 [Clostridium tetanomorphum DSM 665]MBC2397134.1 hypothetical protein [Clostridium tetanomorphum]MBP1863056.1 hypothetical protein [Clostridium tetanomorphum]NRS82885.1 hypothetical protein [Clostridium tetanomorphum]
MNFSSLVLMEIDKETKQFIKELGSYEVTDGAEYITKMYYDGEMVNLSFDVKKDVEDWEYTAIYDLFNEEIFLDKGYIIETIDDEYNPTWNLKFQYIEDIKSMEEKLQELCSLIKEEIDEVFKKIQNKEEDYK